MERVAFLIEQTGQRVECLLNPNSVSITRQSGVRTRQSLGGAVTGLAASDDCLLATGGGVTQLDLELLFDLSKVTGDNPPQDVRTLTAPLWNLAENSSAAETGGAPPQVRFVWGKSWNVPGIVAAVAERFEQFTAAGIAQRSWVSLRLLRVSEPARPATPPEAPAPSPEGALVSGPDSGDSQVHQVTGETGAGGTEGSASAERPDQVAHRYARNPADWRAVMDANPHADPAALGAGMLLVIPRFRGVA